jgi:hypothetical protein
MFAAHRTMVLSGLVMIGIGLGHAGPASAAPPPEQLLPITTREFYASPSVKQARASFRETQLGQLLSDPLLEKFNQDLQQQGQKGIQIEFLGFTLNDLSQLNSGESAWATVEVAKHRPGEVLLLNVAGKEKRLTEVLGDRAKRWKDAGGRERIEQRSDVLLTIQEKAGAGTGSAQRRIHCIKDGLLIASDTIALIDAVLQRWQGSTGNSLADLPAFKAIQEHTKPQNNEAVQVRFFVDPFGLRDLDPPTKGPKKKDRWEQLRKAGLDGFKGVGGFISFNHSDHDVFYHLAVYAPKPYRKGMGVFQFQEGVEFAPPAWVRLPFSSYTSCFIDLPRAFDSLGHIYDQVLVEGEEGTFQETLADLKKDPKLRLDVRAEIVGQLGNRVILLHESSLPTTKKSDHMLLAIPVKNHKILEDAVYRFYSGDDRMRKRTLQGRTIWEVSQKQGQGGESKDAQDLPYHAVVVTNTFFYLTNKIELLEGVLRREQDKDNPLWLGKQDDYQRYLREAARLGCSKAVSQQFSYLADDLRVVYEMARRNQLQGTDSLYAELLLRLLENSKIKLKGDLLPEYNKINHYLGTAGNLVRLTPDGWELIGFHPKKGR